MTLTSLIVFPFLISFVLVFLHNERTIRIVTLVAGFIEIGLALPFLHFDIHATGFQFVEHYAWIPQWGLSYFLGIDGISLLMILLTILLLPLCVLCSWKYIGKRIKEFHICILLMTSVCVGVFAALNMVLFYIFWEAMLVPMFLIIAVWGGPRRQYAAIKFMVYTLAASTLLFVAIVAFYVQAGTFSIPQLMATHFSFQFQFWAFLAMALAFAVKVPMFPFHTWLPAAHVEAPTAGSVLLASVLLKMGTYGFLRFCLPLTPDAAVYFSPLMIAISIASIIYGGLVALGQKDIKKLIAYSSVAHMGFVTLGIFVFTARGIEGAVFQMLNHGVTTGALFMLVGALYERTHSRQIVDNLGLAKYVPAYIGFFGLFTMSSLGFPGLNSFVGEALVLIGAFQRNVIVGALAIPGAMLTAAYMLRLLQKMAWGTPAKGKGLPDLDLREWAYILPLAFLVIYLGLAPTLTRLTIDTAIPKTLNGVKHVIANKNPNLLSYLSVTTSTPHQGVQK